MALLGKKVDYLDEEIEESEEYQIPSVFREDKREISLKKSIFLSTLLHPTIVGLAWILIFALTLLGIKFVIFDKPKPKPKDIEFVLVQKEAKPINKNTKYRSDKNSRAGGKHDPKRKVSSPQAAAPKAPAQKKSVSTPKPKPKTVQKPKSVVKPKKKPTPTPKPKAKKKPTPKPKAKAPTFAPRPKPKPTAPKPTKKPKSAFSIPIPKSAIPKIAMPSGGPVTSSQKKAHSGGSGSGAKSPSPSFSPSYSTPKSSYSGGRFSGSHGSSSGNIGNPGPGNPKGAPGIDAIKEPDFGPYMRALQRRIKMNWDPPKGDESKRVVLLFSISRDGRLLKVKVHKSSGQPAADKAAVAAVQLTAPFSPLPPEYKGSSVEIQFTFDYNVFGASRY